MSKKAIEDYVFFGGILIIIGFIIFFNAKIGNLSLIDTTKLCNLIENATEGCVQAQVALLTVYALIIIGGFLLYKGMSGERIDALDDIFQIKK